MDVDEHLHGHDSGQSGVSVTIFGPTRREQLASEPIVPNPQWKRQMDRTLIGYADVAQEALRITGRDVGSVDPHRMLSGVVATAESQLQLCCEGMSGLDWGDVKVILDRSDFTPEMLSDYLSTCGTSGAAVNDRYADMLEQVIPELVAKSIREGAFDATGPAAEPRQMASGFQTADRQVGSPPAPGPLQSIPSSTGMSAPTGAVFDPGPVGGTVSSAFAASAGPVGGPVSGHPTYNPGSRPPFRPSRGLLYGAAGGLVAVVLAVMLGMNTGPKIEVSGPMVSDTDSAGNDSAGNDSGQYSTDGPTGNSSSVPGVSSPNSLNVDLPMGHPACDGSGIVVLANAVTPGRYDSEIQGYLNRFPGASYLRTDESCSSLRQRDEAGNPIYSVYRPAGRTQAQICAAVRAAGGDAYGKRLDNTTDPGYIIPC